MLRAIFALGIAILSALAMASKVYVQRGADGRVTFSDAASMSPNATLHTIKPATTAGMQASTPVTIPHQNEALTVLNTMEQRNLQNIAESKAKLAKLYKQAADEKNPNVRSNLLSQIQVETQSTEIYTINLNQIKKNKDALNKESSI
jgi:hypothetical protein